MSRALGVSGGLLLAIACNSVSPPPAPLPVPAVSAAGCAAMRVDPTGGGPICERPQDGRLRLWMDTPYAITARAGPTRLAADETAAASGRRLALVVPAGASSLSLEFAWGDARAEWALSLAPAMTWPAIEAARARRAAGDSVGAATALRDALDALPAGARGSALGLLARLETDADRVDEALGLFERAASASFAAGRISTAVDDVQAQVFTLLRRQHRIDAARARLGDLDGTLDDYAEGRARFFYFRGLVGLYSGDLRGALRDLERATKETDALGMERERLHAVQRLAEAWQRVGRGDEAAAWIEPVWRSPPASATPCDRAMLANDVGWLRLLARESGTARGASPGSADPRPPLRAARALFTDACAVPYEAANNRINLALAELQAGRPDAAAAHVDAVRAAARADETVFDPFVAVWADDIRGRIALARGDVAAARRHFDALASQARRAGSADLRWRAAMGRAAVAVAVGELDAAAAAYADAESALDDQSLRVPIGEVRDAFLGDRGRSARERVALLLRMQRPDAAFVAARRARRRSLASLRRVARLAQLSPAAQRSWDAAISTVRRARAAVDEVAGALAEAEARPVPLDQQAARDARIAELTEALERGRGRLARALDDAAALVSDAADDAPLDAPAPGEVWLMWARGDAGWIGFAATASGVRAIAVEPPSFDTLLTPFDVEIDAAERVVVLDQGEIEAIDVHAAPWRDAPLASRKPVSYAVDVGMRAVPSSRIAAAIEGGARAVVVADPTGDLPAAAAEGRAVRDALAAHGWSVNLIEGRDATAAAIAAALEDGVDLLHYAGHGRFDAEQEWRSVLPLAGHDGWGIGDILALPRPPVRVALLSCETARAPRRDTVAAMGIARAFAVAGVREVIAPTRKVDDRVSGALAGALYDEGFARGRDGASALGAAVASLGRDASAFRLIRP